MEIIGKQSDVQTKSLGLESFLDGSTRDADIKAGQGHFQIIEVKLK